MTNNGGSLAFSSPADHLIHDLSLDLPAVGLCDQLLLEKTIAFLDVEPTPLLLPRHPRYV